jgi:hypothetical protein
MVTAHGLLTHLFPAVWAGLPTRYVASGASAAKPRAHRITWHGQAVMSLLSGLQIDTTGDRKPKKSVDAHFAFGWTNKRPVQ